MSEMAIIILAGAILVAAVILVLSMRRPRPAHDQNEMVAVMREQLASLTERLQMLSENQLHSQAALQKSFEERLDMVSQRLNQNMTETSTKTAETLGKLHTRLNVIDEAQKNLTDLSGQVVGLQDILANKQARGAFGEVQMSEIVSNALPPSAYTFQATLSNGRRPDCLLQLPNPPGAIVIDAKFPLESYHALRNAEDEAQKKTAARAFRDAVTKHVRDIEARYIVAGETAESALMFLPSEAIYAELHTNFVDIVRKSYELRVWIVSPTTLMATLNTVRAVLKDVRMREQAHIIQKEVAELAKDVTRLDKRVGNLQSHFAQVNKDISEIGTSTDKIVRRTGRIEDLQLEDGDTAGPVDNVGNLTPLKRIS